MFAPNLNAHIQWDSVCTALQIPFNGKALPQRTHCPLCGKFGLDIFNDTNTGGQWHHCVYCGTAGDMLDLACSVWKVDISAAVAGLTQAGVTIDHSLTRIDRLNSHISQHTSYRGTIKEMWNNARAAYPECRDSDVLSIQHHYGLKVDISHSRWSDGPGKLIGCAHFQAMEKAIGSRTDSITPTKLFKGYKWGQVVLTAFHDLPDRIAAFACLGRRGDLANDHVFKRLQLKQGGTEAGLAGIAAVGLAGNPKTIIAADDWLTMLYVQMKAFRTSLKPLPMVAWRDDGHSVTRDAWSIFHDKEIIFWSLKMNHLAVMQAVRTDGCIAIVGPGPTDHHTVRHYLRVQVGGDLERQIHWRSRPWPLALKQWCEKTNNGESANLFTRLEQAGADVSYILRRMGGDGNRRPITRRAVNLDSSSIVEQNDAWTLESSSRKKPGKEISNAVLRIHHVVQDSTTNELFYAGEIRHKNRIISVIAPVDVVKNNTEKWMSQQMLEKGLGVLLTHRSFASRLHAIAILFNEPELVKDDLWKWTEKLG